MTDSVVERLNAALESRYAIERELGEGGMATVYLARDRKHNRNVALKVLKRELSAVVGADRFLAEIETTADLQHPHILPPFDSGECRRLPLLRHALRRGGDAGHPPRPGAVASGGRGRAHRDRRGERPGLRPPARRCAPGHQAGRATSLVLLAALASCSESPADVRPGDVEPPADIVVRLSWPMGGVEGKDWVINNYVDLDPGPGLLDYRGGAKVYDGHRGIDIDVPNFRWMDGGFAVLAAAPGTVTGLEDGHFDRNVSCSGDWNYVDVTHGDGTRAIYGHLKAASVAVALGATVSAGQPLGVVGSSGCSTQPHLHLELHDADNRVIDPFQRQLWVDPPAYDPPLTFMDLNVQNGGIGGVDDLKDPPPNVTTTTVGATLGIGVSMAGGGPGDIVRVTLVGGDGTIEHDLSVTFDRVWRHTYWYWNRSVTANPGTWRLTVWANDSLSATYTFAVS